MATTCTGITGQPVPCIINEMPAAVEGGGSGGGRLREFYRQRWGSWWDVPTHKLVFLYL
jgi:hypothetical protein